MSQHDDELIDQDPLYEFANESEPIPRAAAPAPDSTQSVANADVAPRAQLPDELAASHEALTTRLDRLEHIHDRTLDQLSLLRAELATLVTSINDIKRDEVPRPTAAVRPPRTIAQAPPRRTLPALAGVLAGVAIALLGWMTWQRDSTIAVAESTTPPVAAEASAPVPDIAPAPEPPAITPAPNEIVEPPQTREVRTRGIVEPHRADTTYVGTLSIDSSPGGAVLINGKPAGHTPLLVNNLKAGSHLVWIERDGYRRFTRVVQVTADRVSRLFADLEPLTP